jgi:hypothetical protein
MDARWAVQTEVSLVATLREWIVALSHFIFNNTPLNIVLWPSPWVMQVKDLEIDIGQFFSKVKSTFQQLHVHICEKVLFGIPTSAGFRWRSYYTILYQLYHQGGKWSCIIGIDSLKRPI